jgi:hypothetical protein
MLLGREFSVLNAYFYYYQDLHGKAFVAARAESIAFLSMCYVPAWRQENLLYLPGKEKSAGAKAQNS